MRSPERGVQRIAVLRANALGDFVFCVPALAALRAAYPAAEIVLLGRPWHREFLQARPGPVDRVVVVPPSRGVRGDERADEDPRELERFFERMRGECFDVALQLHGGGRFSNPFVTRLGARLTAGCRAEDAPPLDRWIRYVYLQPEIARWLEVAALVGARAVGIDPAIAVTEDDREAARELVDPGPFAVLHPGATDERRRWPASRFAEVGDALAAEGLRVVVTGTEPERKVVAAVRAQMRAESTDACATLSLGGLCGLLGAASLVVSNDTGPLHLANAGGAPTVGIFWIGNLVNGAPLYRDRHRPLPAFRTQCPVCGAVNVTSRCEHDACFVDEVSADDVLRAALELVARRPAGRVWGAGERVRAAAPRRRKAPQTAPIEGGTTRG
ncbi:MAG TPA: glycosyltransferase family 9 protein [Solirubrobacteraceae bacterium]|nr:glycosyltransferase family 9 protein [Solirubrobacteraceae bacterium]